MPRRFRRAILRALPMAWYFSLLKISQGLGGDLAQPLQGRPVHRPREGAAGQSPIDGHTLATVVPEIQAQIGASLSRIVAERVYRGHNAPPDQRFKVYISGQRRGVTDAIKRDLRRRSAVEPVIGHAKNEHPMGHNFFKGRHGDAANSIFAAAGYNFRRLLAWLAALWRALIAAWLAGLRLAAVPAEAEA